MGASTLKKILDTDPVGSIIKSLLTEAQFQSINGTGWVLMDGRSVVGSSYAALTGQSSIPDARGLFLRSAGTNATRTKANGNAVSGGSIGSLNNDKMQGHGHQFNYSVAIVKSGSSNEAYSFRDQAPNGTYVNTPLEDGTNGTPRIGDETAPASVSVNVFIKIN